MSTLTAAFDDPTAKPSVARMYDYLLGGYHNFGSDRAAAEAATAIYPDFPLVMQANRAFLRRAVTFLVEQGIDQFLDLGSGIPTAGNVHEVAQGLNPAARVVYVDNDPVAVAQSAALLQENLLATIVHADVTHAAPLLQHPEVQRLLDFERPLAVLLISLLHFIPDDAVADGVVQALRAQMAAGSYLGITHTTYEGTPRQAIEQLESLYAASAGVVKPRTRAHVAAFFDGCALVEPGLVYTPLWRPEDPLDALFAQPERSIAFAAVGRKL